MVTRPVRTRSAKLDLRLTPEAKEVIYAAAAAAQRTVSEFVLESALSQAEQTLADRRRFSLDAEQWTAFMNALDSSPRDIPRLNTLLRTPGVFDSPDQE